MGRKEEYTLNTRWAGKADLFYYPPCNVPAWYPLIDEMIEIIEEYNSDEEALADVQDPNSNTKSEHIRRDVKITVESIPLGADVNIF